MAVPTNPKIYHITHLKNIERILEAQMLWSDRRRIELGLDCEVVGMSRIKERRLNQLEVTCHPGTRVGDYVPFYFAPRSVMLYILYKGNHPDLQYDEGQGPIVHLQADLRNTVEWADAHNIKWAFSDRNAGAYMAEFFNDLDSLDNVNWDAVASNSFSDAMIREGKQAEFLIHESFPWQLIEQIGVINNAMVGNVLARLVESPHRPPVDVRRVWYY